MEFDYKTDRPLVRVGSLQSEKKINFTSLVPFNVVDLSGEVLLTEKSEKSFEVSIVNSEPADLKPMIRLAISYNQTKTRQLVKKWEKSGLQVHFIQVGENTQICKDEYIDNREYWILASGFSSREEAEQRRRELQDFGSYQVFLIAEKPANGKLLIENKVVENGIRLLPIQDGQFPFILNDVRVGIGFHWDHRENQKMENILEIRIDKKGLLTAINVLDLEHYLASVNSSEMAPKCNLEFLKAQTVVARSTVFATAGKHHYGDPFDICADDHCQCFHGSGAIQPKSLQAAEESQGLILLSENRICDTRYAKVCGSIGESYQNVWDDRYLPYLDKFYDGKDSAENFQTVESEDRISDFINSDPDVFCNPQKHKVPEHLEYAHLYFRWQKSYTPEKLGEIVAEKLNKNLGPIRDIIPLKRGYSGRLIYIKLVGDFDEIVIGKELEIRRALSTSHLYSACFYIKRDINRSGEIKSLTLFGAGWGHGVGLCQVGAAIMGEEGYTCEQILKHYYEVAELKKIY